MITDAPPDQMRPTLPVQSPTVPAAKSGNKRKKPSPGSSPDVSPKDPSNQPSAAAAKSDAPLTSSPDDGVNRTQGTQADKSLNGIPASRCPLLSQYIRVEDQIKSNFNRSILKPKKCTTEEWDAVAVNDRTLWVIWRKCLKEAHIDSSDFPFSDFQRFVADEQDQLQSFIESRDEKLKKLQETNSQKITRQTKAVDRKLRERFRDTKMNRDALINALAVQQQRNPGSDVLPNLKIKVKVPTAPSANPPQVDSK